MAWTAASEVGKLGTTTAASLGGVCVSVGQELFLQVAGHCRLGRLQAGLQIGELSRHVQQLQGGGGTDGDLVWVCVCVWEL